PPVGVRPDVARLARDPGAEIGQRGAGVLELAPSGRPDRVWLERLEQLGEDLDELVAPAAARRDVGQVVAGQSDLHLAAPLGGGSVARGTGRASLGGVVSARAGAPVEAPN